MRKDIFIDNNIAKNFSNPVDPEYKKLVAWLFKFDEGSPNNNAYLAISNKILVEYGRTSAQSRSDTNIFVLIDKLKREGRTFKVGNSAIKAFQRTYFKGPVQRNLNCDASDRDHIPVVLLSDRKYALSLDHDFVSDLMEFPGFSAIAARRPQDLPYEG